MTETMKKFLRITYYAAITTTLVVVAALLMIACVSIYRSGESPFTPEAIALHFDRVAVPVYVCLGLIALGFILHPLLPAAPEKDVDRDRMTVKRLRRLTDLQACPAELSCAIRREQSQQRLHQWIAILLTGIGGIGFLVFVALLDPAAAADPTAFVLRCCTVLLLCLIAGTGYGLFSLFYNRGSYRREIALYRQAPAEAKCSAPEQKDPAWEAPLKNAILMVALGLIIVGVANNGQSSVLGKAVEICMECVGLG